MAYNVLTFGNSVDEAFFELGVDSGNTVAGLSQAQMEQWANRFSKIFIEKVKLNTQRDTYSFRTLADTTLASNASSGATSLTLSTSNATLGYPTSGLVSLDAIPYTYSNIVTTAMTTEALDRAYSSGDAIQAGYAVPTNFGKPIGLFIGGGSDMYPTVGGARYELQKWGTEELIKSGKFAIFNDFIILPRGLTGGQDVTLHYYKKASNTLTTASSNEMYQMWDGYVIQRLVARGYRILRDLEQAKTYETLAHETLVSARQQVAEEDMSPNRGFSTKSFR